MFPGILALLLFVPTIVFSVNIEGVVRDAQTGEVLIGANVLKTTHVGLSSLFSPSPTAYFGAFGVK